MSLGCLWEMRNNCLIATLLVLQEQSKQGSARAGSRVSKPRAPVRR